MVEEIDRISSMEASHRRFVNSVAEGEKAVDEAMSDLLADLEEFREMLGENLEARKEALDADRRARRASAGVRGRARCGDGAAKSLDREREDENG